MKIILLTRENGKKLLTSLKDCTAEAVRAGGGFGWIEIQSEELLLQHWKKLLCHSDNTRILVAVEDDKVIGSVQLVLATEKNQAGNFVGEVSTLFVHPSYRGRGAGLNLLIALEKLARESGLLQINLDVRDSQKEAIALYKSMGFRAWGRNPRYARVGNQFFAGLYMSKYLDEDILQ